MHKPTSLLTVALLFAAGLTLAACDESHNPVDMMLLLTRHHLQTERMIRQAQASLPTRKRLWQSIHRQKVGI